MATPSSAAETVDAIPEREIRDELERVLQSEAFRRSQRSRRFLAYVCKLTLEGQAERINEYLIGSEVFDRGPSYSPSEDSVVRRQAHSLRLKLDSYYANEGAGNSTRIDLPVGQYVPAFRRWHEPPAPRPERGASIPVSKPAANSHRLLWAGLLAIAMLGLGWLAGSRYAVAPSTAAPPGVTEIWGPWLADLRAATICFANSKVAVVHHVPDETLEDAHPEHFRPSAEADSVFRRAFGIGPGGYLYFRPSDVKTSVAESISAVALSRFLGQYGMHVSATQSRLINWEDLRSGNFIILGHNEANPWVDSLLRNQPFGLGDSKGVRRFIVNRSPAEGEASRYEKESGGGPGRPVGEYALISMLPGVSRSNRLLLISGLDGQATQLAAEYLTDSEFLEDLAARLRGRDPDRTDAWHFQVVIRAVVRDRVPTTGEIVALRVLS